ncbi:heat-shock protein [Cellulosimicrobium cellulans]|uniref:BbrUII/HgiDII family restriction enzyme n=1 Tax=Cellulosimicrobium cellulans TaxID=1710 RepID=UPI0018833CD0|nr:ATP-binding protein [Cellulosimicrobium cellulans]MBE9925059.1 heat-shock protein [Cellulosimicrobium cellulans]
MTEHDYTMTISLNVLNHLGINLYSNVPAVLSEVVANSYDADAETVRIILDTAAETVTITDDGHGMTRAQVNARFLNVGYRRRDEAETAVSPKFKRLVMGRKGIGKLSLFSIANTVEVYTARDGERSALRMSVPAIREALTEQPKADGEINPHQPSYHPESLDQSLVDLEHGTRIVLKDLKKGIANAAAALRVRLARRFTVIGSDNFRLFIGPQEVTVSDRDYFHKLQYVWLYGEEDVNRAIAERCLKASRVTPIGKALVPVNSEEGVRSDGDAVDSVAAIEHIEVSGWIGTADTVGSLKDSTTRDNLNKLSLVVRGKVAHEDLLEEFNENGIYSSYLIGELHADALDLDSQEDIATSSRQRIVEDDPRFAALKRWLRGEITRIGNQWTDLRNEQGVSTALDDPVIKEWFATLRGDTRKKAVSLFGKINQLTIDDEKQRTDLFAQAVLGFETLRYRDNLDALDALEPTDIVAATALFGDVTDIQAALYHQIVQQRIEVIDKLTTHLDENSLERVLQDHLFENLWLLDPGWERATDRKKEERIGATFTDIQVTQDEKDARMDIRYKRTGGMNVIVELKRAKVLLADHDIIRQVDKYKDAVQRYLDATGSIESIEVVVVVGRPLKNWTSALNKTQSIQSLAMKNIRVVEYEKLLADAQAGYREYLDAQHDLGRIQQMLMKLAERVDMDTDGPVPAGADTQASSG